jgi:lipopolysaccharide transport system ATP-binding protein
MSEVAIRVEGLGKRYAVGGGAPYLSLRDSLAALPRRLLGRSPRKRGREEIWALKDVSFEVKQGEVLGVIGRNGAGKSTLLKILSRITRPTKGRAEVWGRVGSLLEVGTGFHPELTGRENIWLYGAILGLKRHEIQKKFDEIVAFSEVEAFLDTPLKHYSSGMQMRLAFSVAAHLEPEVLLVDEVLAVGDAGFQRKCLGKMEDVQKGGRTVVFVSHNEGAVHRLCSRVALLEAGSLVYCGPSETAFAKYRRCWAGDLAHGVLRTHSSSIARLERVVLLHEGVSASAVAPGAPLEVEIQFHVFTPANVCAEFLLRDERHVPVGFCSLGLLGWCHGTMAPGLWQVRSTLACGVLAAGNYTIDVMLAEPGVRFFDYLEAVLEFSVLPVPHEDTGWVFSQKRGQGCVLLNPTAVIGPVRLSQEQQSGRPAAGDAVPLRTVTAANGSEREDGA